MVFREIGNKRDYLPLLLLADEQENMINLYLDRGIVDEVFLTNDELYAKAIDEDGDEVEFMLYPIGENEFGRKGGMLKLTFSDDCVAYDDLTCKKL